MYIARARVFLGLGLLFLPVVVVITLLQWAVVGLLDLFAAFTGDVAGAGAFLALVLGTTLTLFGLTFLQAATALALVELDAGRPFGALAAYRLAARSLRPLLRATAIGVLVWIVLTTTTILIPVAVWLAVRWLLLAPAVALEGETGLGALRRSAELVRGRWFRVGSLVGLGAAIALAAGPLLGALLIFTTAAPFALLNIVAGVVYALALPFVALTTAYVYFDAHARHELEPADDPDELPAEIELGRA
jgi:hypothetical protein